MAQNDKHKPKHGRVSGLEVIYTIFLGLLIAVFFGLGISAFYPEPQAPEYPIELATPTKTDQPSTEQQINLQRNYDQDLRQYQTESKNHNRNVSIIALVLAVIALAISLIFIDQIHVISDGLMLGGVFTLVYSMIRGLMVDDTKYSFVIVSIGLIVSMALGYIKFVKPKSK